MGCLTCLTKITRRTTSENVVTTILFLLFFVYYLHSRVNTGIPKDIVNSNSQFGKIKSKQKKEIKVNITQEIFAREWCKQTLHRVDWNKILRPCREYLAWGSNQKLKAAGLKTDATKSYISLWGIKPAGQFSRLGLRAVTADNRPKRSGGDSWRVRISGPSSISPTVIDHSNGTYEIIFLVLEPGQYKVQIVLEHSLCDGYMDPPKDWFIKGNSQGKYQSPGVLPGDDRPFLIQPLWGGMPLNINVPPIPDFQNFNAAKTRLKAAINNLCPQRCNHLWNGLGRWKGKRWTPYFDANQGYHDQLVRRRREGTLWIYGDSIGDLFYKSILKRPLCTTIFKQCHHTYNWVYSIPGGNLTRARLEKDDFDFSVDRILDEITAALTDNNMDKNSVMIFNLGLHYVQNINFTSYQQLIDRVIKLFSGYDKRLRKFPGAMIWKTTTAINMEKYGDPMTNARHSKLIRFLTYQRVLLYNAYATQAMCTAGFPVLDVFPLSDSYENGTGLPHKPYDAVHYPNWVFESVIRLLENYFKLVDS